MKVKELILELQKYDQEFDVYRADSEFDEAPIDRIYQQGEVVYIE